MPARPRSASSPRLLRGMLFTLTRRCGQPTCRCARGAPHPSPALAYPAGGRTRTLTPPSAQVPAVRAALARYARARAALDAAAAAGVETLRAQRGADRDRRA